ncbi:hypothetical protein [Virgibacillus sp. Bac332]|uniref:hypothetical protein n=1 Tax=Virgibacillus sp. Bac332 TaxID=2419842 RepID=UPI0013CEA1A7|nr:hypothetical protein [Virgibacillus sp. Bac332]
MIDYSVPFYNLSEEDKLVDNFDQDSIVHKDKKWYAVSKSYIGHSYSGWKYAAGSTISGCFLTASHIKSVSNTYSGSLTVTKNA